MSLNQMVRVFSVLGIIGAVISIVGNVLRWVNPDFFARSLTNSIGLSLMLIGMFATYVILARDLSRFGLISYIIAFLGIVWITCMVWGFTFFGPVLQDFDPTFTADKSFADMQTPMKGGLMSAVLLEGIGTILFGLSIVISSKTNRIAGFLLIVGGIVGFILMNGIYVAGPILQSIAIILICLRAFQSNSTSIGTSISG